MLTRNIDNTIITKAFGTTTVFVKALYIFLHSDTIKKIQDEKSVIKRILEQMEGDFENVVQEKDNCEGNLDL